MRKHRTFTDFELKWGVTASQLALQEGVSIAAIHMRVRNYGTPFQRRSVPTECERMTGRTLTEWAKALDLHPVTVYLRMQRHNDPLYDPGNYGKGNRHKKIVEERWHKKMRLDPKKWLHQSHPDYAKWMSNFTQYDSVFAGKE